MLRTRRIQRDDPLIVADHVEPHGQPLSIQRVRKPLSPLAQGDAVELALIDHAAKPEIAYGHKASMLQDVEARRTTEIDYLNGGIVRFGREHDVPTPLNEAIWALVKGVENSWQQ